jgi:hypothetical protein
MIVLPHTLVCQPSVQIHNGTAAVFATLSNLMHPVFVGDLSIQHPVTTTAKNAFTAFCLELIFLTSRNIVFELFAVQCCVDVHFFGVIRTGVNSILFVSTVYGGLGP